MRIADSGTGIDDATRAHIFEPFFTTKSPDRGTGLGLPTVHAIVKESGGCVDLESRAGRNNCRRRAAGRRSGRAARRIAHMSCAGSPSSDARWAHRRTPNDLRPK
ncbi:MAG: ATP-binding protein [Gemmatimonadaceae bacterium]